MMNLFGPLKATDLVIKELRKCELGLIEHEAAYAFHGKLAEYYAERIEHLTLQASGTLVQPKESRPF